jgi:hypothetical protein
VRKKYYFDWKNKLKSMNYKPNEQDHWFLRHRTKKKRNFWRFDLLIILSITLGGWLSCFSVRSIINRVLDHLSIWNHLFLSSQWGGLDKTNDFIVPVSHHSVRCKPYHDVKIRKYKTLSKKIIQMFFQEKKLIK